MAGSDRDSRNHIKYFSVLSLTLERFDLPGGRAHPTFLGMSQDSYFSQRLVDILPGHLYSGEIERMESPQGCTPAGFLNLTDRNRIHRSIRLIQTYPHSDWG